MKVPRIISKLVIFLLLASTSIFAQIETSSIFTSTRLISAHSVETLKARHLDFRIKHHFDDIAGDLGGIYTLFGLDNVTDVRIGLEYGITDNLMIGLGRNKGLSNIGLTKLVDGFLK